MSDSTYMRRAMFHAARATGATTPNPVVGAVVVDADGVVVGQGHHARAGGPHAEVNALAEAGARARGATVYVTLEPCCHTGRTGPCTEQILAAGVRRVVAATLDPYPLVAGRGVATLRAAGVAVDVGVEAEAARRLNAAYLMATECRRPCIVVKAAVSSDGRIAAAPGRRTPITGREARHRVARLRASVDAIAVGVGTVLADDPRLGVREVVRDRPWSRVIFDRRLRTPLESTLLSTPDDGQVIMVTAGDALDAHGPRVAALRRRGALVVAAETLESACRQLAGLGLQAVLVEGGAELHRSLWEADLVDRMHLVVAPQALGPAGVPLFGGFGVPWSRLDVVRAEPCGRDVWIEADVHRHR
ncbi:MAG: bifunctional diaminohydroxyphosphoribosylaminopyrimidine deaminase/5-amino-6-(5-phosphoribosylamino)uracil reductase RibD [Vicinamibacterales bacterium]